MDVIKINRKNKIFSIKELNVVFISEEPDRLLIAFTDEINHKISVGQQLAFRRYVYGEGDTAETITQMVTVLEKTVYNGHNAVYTTVPKNEDVLLKAYYNDDISIKRTQEECVKDYDAYFDSYNHYLMVKIGDKFEINDWCYYYNSNDDEYFVIKFSGNHRIYQQDVYITNEYVQDEYRITVKNQKGSIIGTIGGVSIPFTGLPYTVGSADTLSCVDFETCGKIDKKGMPYLTKVCKYTHTPDSFSKDMVIFRSAKTTHVDGDFFTIGSWLITNGKHFEPMYNPFYFYKMEGSLKRGTLWYDPWWSSFDLMNGQRPLKTIYVNSGHTRSVFGPEDDYWNIPALALSSDNYAIGIEEGQEGQYVNDIIDRAIPPVIDMERFKYMPVIVGSYGYTKVKSIIFDFHFRKRTITEEIPSRLAEEGKYPIYDDGWYVDQDSGQTAWWNGMTYSGTSFNSTTFTEFYNARGKVSDLVGYLGFDDEDIYYRKSKVAMSFIRISFYTSKDPLEQKLLYYSTSFLDSTSLYGKYMKQSLYKYGKYGENEDTPIVFFPDDAVSSRTDTEICIKNEMNMMASSEGFNLYLFADDAEITDEGKPYRTIYMKVEFNHAGNGKTIPMMMWPKDGSGSFRDVTTDTFLDDLYIPVQVGYIDGRYVYSLPTADNEDGNLRLILFEPKLGYDSYGNNAQVQAGSTVRSDSGYGGWGHGGGVTRTTRQPQQQTPTPSNRSDYIDEETYHVPIEINGGNDYVAPEGGDSGSYDGGGNSGSGGGGCTPISLPSKSGKSLYFGAYSVDTFYGRRISLPVFLKCPNGRPTSSNDNSGVYSIDGKLKVTSSNPSVIDIAKNNYTAFIWLYEACDRYTLPAVVHIPANKIKGVGSAVIKVELADNPDVYDTCIVNVSMTNNYGASTSSFAQNNLVYPWETYVRKGAFFDIWMHHHNFYKFEVSVSDDSGVVRYKRGDGIQDSLGMPLSETMQSMAFEALGPGDYTITFEHPDYNGTGKAKVHVIDE